MAVSRQDVRRIAELARLDLTDAEVERLLRDMREILAHVEALGDRTSSLEHPTSSFQHSTSNVDLRTSGMELRASNSEPRAPGFEAPDFRDGFFLVPRLGSHQDEGE